MENTNNFLSVVETGKILDVSKEVVNTWLRKGYIKYSLVGRLQKIRSKDLLEYLKSLGNSPVAMDNFRRDIDNYFRQKQEAKE
jgi:excisionase family DNA binding protein